MKSTDRQYNNIYYTVCKDLNSNLWTAEIIFIRSTNYSFIRPGLKVGMKILASDNRSNTVLTSSTTAPRTASPKAFALGLLLSGAATGNQKTEPGFPLGPASRGREYLAESELANDYA